MVLDISNLTKNVGSIIDFEFDEKIEGLKNIEPDIKFEDTIQFKGSILNENGVLDLTGKINTMYDAICSNCLQNVKNKIDISINEKILRSGEAIEENMYYYDKKVLDLNKIVIDAILLNLPMKQLCSPSCTALCIKCGKRSQSCKCILDKEKDPRFDVLKKLFHK